MEHSEFVEKFDSVGIKAEPYKRGPAGKQNFAISRQRKSIRFWTGNANITISTDKRKRQTLLTVVEPSRIVKTKASIYIGYDCSDDVDEALKDLTTVEQRIVYGVKYVQDNKSYTLSDIKNTTDVFVPNSTMKITDVGIRGNYITFYCDLKTRKTKTCFLVGYDESSSDVPFICQLRKVVKNPAEAREVLRPDGISDKAKRQGEWFFDPVTNESVLKNLNSQIHRLKDGRISNTTHQVPHLSTNGNRYAIGRVKESRDGHHETIVLNTWHRIVRNKEVVVRENATWD